MNERIVTLIGRLTCKGEDDYEIEVYPGVSVVIPRCDVREIEEFVDPHSDTPVAKLTLASTADLGKVLRQRIDVDIDQAQEPLPFTLDRTGRTAERGWPELRGLIGEIASDDRRDDAGHQKRRMPEIRPAPAPRRETKTLEETVLWTNDPDFGCIRDKVIADFGVIDDYEPY